jgi:hypothetical protein
MPQTRQFREEIQWVGPLVSAANAGSALKSRKSASRLLRQIKLPAAVEYSGSVPPLPIPFFHQGRLLTQTRFPGGPFRQGLSEFCSLSLIADTLGPLWPPKSCLRP